MTTATGLVNQPNQPGQLSVQDALLAMQQAVRRGELEQAAAIGASAQVPLNIRLDDLSLLGEIASGGQATVLYGTLSNADVAVKRFKIQHTDDLKRFRRELSILASLAPHPHIVPLLAARALPPDYLLVMPLAATTLHTKLYQFGWRPQLQELLQLATQAAEGLVAVHAKGLVHRDLKPSNLLLSNEGWVWLSDFGLAASVEDVVQESTLSLNMVRSRGKPTGGFMKRAMQGTLEYLAPEVLQKQPASQAADVYALAVSINELATGVYPFSDCTKDRPDVHTVLEHGYGHQELAAAVAAEGLRPTLPQAAPSAFLQLLGDAWQLDPAARPTAAQFRDRLLALLQQQQIVGSVPCTLQPAATSAVQCTGEANLAGLRFSLEQQTPSRSEQSSVTSEDVVMQEVSDDTFTSSEEEGLGVLGSSAGKPLAAAVGYGLFSRTTPSSSRAPSRRASRTNMSAVSADGLSGMVTRNTSSSCLAALSAMPLSTEAGNALATAAAAAVPPAAALKGVLSLTAAASAATQVAEQQNAAGAIDQRPPATVEAGAFGAIGPRESMEDRHVVVQGLGGDGQVTLAAVFDGHRGQEAAVYAAAQLPRHLLLASVALGSSSNKSVDRTYQQQAQAAGCVPEQQPHADSTSGVALALKQAFLNTDTSFWQEWQAEMHANAVVGQYNERYPGCTALAAVVTGNVLFVANAGDGRAVLSRGGKAVQLSRQHTADLEDERARVLAAGGSVVYHGKSWRVGPAALQVTRALGDFDLKKVQQQHSQLALQSVSGQQQLQQQQQGQQQYPYQGHFSLLNLPYGSTGSDSSSSSDHEAGHSSSSSGVDGLGHNVPVTAEPEVVSLHMSPADQFLICGTDGLWDVMTDQEAIGLVRDTVKDPALCAKRLVQEALARGSNDNVTAVVVFLQPKHTLESVWVSSAGGPVPAATPTFYGSRRVATKQLQEQVNGGPVAALAAGVADELMDTY